MNDWVSNGNWELWHLTPGFPNRGHSGGGITQSPLPWGTEEGILQTKHFIPIFVPNSEMHREKNLIFKIGLYTH